MPPERVARLALDMCCAMGRLVHAAGIRERVPSGSTNVR